jgi:RimJ/RimL family protein N-acetyltransferase
MAAFTAADPDDRAAFDAHMAKLRSSPDLVLLAVTRDGELVGSVGSFVMDGQQEITYWIDRSAWGQGVASRAVALLLDLVRVRPMRARAASDNAGSLAVLRRAGFRIVGTDVGYANARRILIAAPAMHPRSSAGERFHCSDSACHDERRGRGR